MKRKITALILIVGLMVSGVVFTSADMNIVNSMDFQGDAIELSLDDAIALAMTESSSGKTAEWNKAKAKAAHKDNRLNAQMARQLSKTSKDAKISSLMSEFAIEQMDRNYQAEINTLEAKVKEMYFGLLQAQDLMKINEENLEVVEKLYSDAKTKFDLGMVPKQDTLKAEYNYLKAQTDYKAAVNTYKKAKMGFNIFMNYDVMQEIQLTDELKDVEIQDIEIADAISQALINRNEVIGAKYQNDLQKLLMEKIEVRYPYNSGTYIEQKALYEEAVYDYESVFNAIEMDTRSKYLDMIEKKQAIEAGRKSVESAQEGLRLVQLTYDAGMSVLTDVQEIQTMVLQSKLALSKAILDYNLAVEEFNDAMGVGRTLIPII